MVKIPYLAKRLRNLSLKSKKYLDSWIETNCNNSVSYYEKILASIIKTGVLCVQAGEHPKVAEYKMTVLIPRELIPDSLLPSSEKYFRRQNGV